MKYGLVGPRSVSPRNAAVLVATPSIGFGPRSISSTKTPGARYSGIAILLGSLSHGLQLLQFGADVCFELAGFVGEERLRVGKIPFGVSQCDLGVLGGF